VNAVFVYRAAPMDLATLKQVAEDFIPFNKFLGIQATIVEHGRVRLEIPWRDELVGDPVRGALHGGVISMLADTAGGMVIWSVMDNAMARLSTIDLRIDYLRPGKLERLAADATVVRVGGRVGVADIRLFHLGSESETVATGKGVYAIKIPKAH
jgi:uncharacterized protein (TIGR00369 family)